MVTKGLTGLEKLHYLLTLANFLLIVMEALEFHPLLVWLFEENSSLFFPFLSSLKGGSIQLVYPLGILFQP